jgi:hypothetical protein
MLLNDKRRPMKGIEDHHRQLLACFKVIGVIVGACCSNQQSFKPDFLAPCPDDAA